MTAEAITVGVLLGSFSDPVFWICLVVAAVVAFMPKQHLILTAALFIAAVVRLLISEANRQSLGLEGNPLAAYIALATILAMLAVYGAAWLMRRVLRR